MYFTTKSSCIFCKTLLKHSSNEMKKKEGNKTVFFKISLKKGGLAKIYYVGTLSSIHTEIFGNFTIRKHGSE